MRFPTPDARNQRLGALLSLLLVAGVIGFAGSAAFATGATTVTIGSTLSPQSITVAPGTTVTWTNSDGAKHRVRGETGSTKIDSGGALEKSGSTFSFTFGSVGSYPYLDAENDKNPALQGSVTVTADGSGGSGGGGGGAGGTAPPAPATATVSLSGKAFNPASTTVAVGGTVTWTNNDGMTHNVTSNTGAFASPNFNQGGTFTFTFTAPGTYNYRCTLHGGMNGTIVVPAANGSVPPPAPDAPAPPPRTGTAPGGPANTPAAPGKPGKHTITVTDAGFTPATLDARAGDTVVWVNTGQAPHTATSAGGEFDVPLDVGGSGSFVLQAPGTISYKCSFHPYMVGTINVGAALAGTVIAPNKPAPKKKATATKAGGTGAKGAAPAANGKGKTYQVKLGDNFFSPSSLNARVGDTITWTNNGKMPHTVTSSDGQFDQQLQPGASFSYALRKQGKLSYVCTYHPGMAASITVGAPLAGVKVPPASAGSTSSGGSSSAAAAAAAVAAAPAAPPSTGQTKTYEVKVQEMSFAPKVQTARVGDTISWVNVGTIPHTVTAKDGSFDKTLAPGARFNYQLRKVGTLDYVCTFHLPGMVGSLVVKPALAGVTVPAASDAAGQAAAAPPIKFIRTGGITKFQVEVKDNSFSPGMISAHVGDTVTWINVGKLTHTVTAADKSFDKSLKPGQKWTLKLTKAGTINYVCTPHHMMFGMIMVAAQPSGPAPAGPPKTLSSVSPIAMAGFGTGWLVLLGMLTTAQLRARLGRSAGRKTASGTPVEDAS